MKIKLQKVLGDADNAMTDKNPVLAYRKMIEFREMTDAIHRLKMAEEYLQHLICVGTSVKYHLERKEDTEAHKLILKMRCSLYKESDPLYQPL